MNRQELIHLLKAIKPHHYAIGSTDLYTYIITPNPQSKRREAAKKAFVLNKISQHGCASHCIFFDYSWEILHHLACKTMVLYATSSNGLQQQLTCLRTGEHSAGYLIH